MLSSNKIEVTDLLKLTIHSHKFSYFGETNMKVPIMPSLAGVHPGLGYGGHLAPGRPVRPSGRGPGQRNERLLRQYLLLHPLQPVVQR